MKKGLLITGIVVLVAALAVPVAFAQHQRHGGHDGFGGFGPFARMHKLAGQLDLTDAQKSQIHDIAMDVREQSRESRKAMHANMIEAGKVLIANPDDLAAAQAILAKNAEPEATMKANILKGVSQALQILTPDQRTKLATLLEEHLKEK